MINTMNTDSVPTPTQAKFDSYCIEYARLGHCIQYIGNQIYLIDGNRFMNYQELKNSCISEYVASNC